MRPRFAGRPAKAALTALATAAASAGIVLGTSGAAQAAHTGTLPMPAHVFAPYFESYNPGSPAAMAQQAGAKYLTMAFLQTPTPGSCTADWNGDPSTPVATSSYGADFAAMQAEGGNLVPSFGGYAADTTGTDIADSCTSVPAIAAVYENVITTYHVSRIDLDVEADSLSNTAGITRRDQAVAIVDRWARQHHLPIQFSYTMPSTSTGLPASAVNVLRDAIANGARVDVVNAMTFDYYYGTQQEMATDTETAGAGLVAQLHALYPDRGTARLWHMVGITEMVGIDDFGAAETFTQADATTVLNWAREKDINTLTFWALQRDNGGCPGTKGAGTCSGLAQPTWYFSHVFERFGRHGHGR
jgi:hypothetical protein